MSTLYDTSPWRKYRSRVLTDDADCAFAELAGNCRGPLHVHHVKPVSEGGPAFPRENDGTLVLCASHHALLHAWRRRQQGRPARKRCPHNHRYEWARRECEARLNASP